MLSRLQSVEDELVEVERVLDAVLSDAVYEPTSAAFNGQAGRQAIVRDLVDQFGFATVIETGTHFGNTAGYLATEFGLAVQTCELVPRYVRVASHLLRQLPTVEVHHLDSRQFLRQLAGAHHTSADRPFVYLDAHWHADLPLAEELDLVAENWPEWVAMIDDFRVPGDEGYGFDDYGPGRRLDLDYLAPVLARHGLTAFFPTLPSSAETGARRGCMVTCAPALTPQLAASRLLRTSPSDPP